MDTREQKEERNKRIGWLTSLATQLVLLILFYFLIAWREPFPPIPEYGIELGITSSAGASSASSQAAPIQEETPPEEVVEEQIEEAVEEQAEPELEEVIPSNEAEAEPVQEVEDVPIIEDPVEEVPSEEIVEEVSKEEQVDERALMPNPSSSTEGEKNEETDGEADTEEIDERALYGSEGQNTGSSEGASLSLAGWIWDFEPRPDDTSEQTGKIVYKIEVDQDGYLVKIETAISTVSPAVERKYRQAVEKLTFSKTGDYQSASRSSGTITFIIRSK